MTRQALNARGCRPVAICFAGGCFRKGLGLQMNTAGLTGNPSYSFLSYSSRREVDVKSGEGARVGPRSCRRRASRRWPARGLWLCRRHRRSAVVVISSIKSIATAMRFARGSRIAHCEGYGTVQSGFRLGTDPISQLRFMRNGNHPRNQLCQELFKDTGEGMSRLLDVNVLVALAVSDHIHHPYAASGLRRVTVCS